MKKLPCLSPFLWPALLASIALSLLAIPILLLEKNAPPACPVAGPAEIRYAMRSGMPVVESNEIAEIRALYAPDLFASSRNNRLPAMPSEKGRPVPPDVIPPENLPIPAFPAAPGKNGAEPPPVRKRKIEHDAPEPERRFHAAGRPDQQAKNSARGAAGKQAKLYVELEGGLKNYPIKPDYFQDIIPFGGQKPWSIRAEIRLNADGQVEQVLAEPSGCAPDLCREIVKRLYLLRPACPAQAGEGAVTITCQ
ncbi:MAG: hypothetical protein PHP98_08795 [Kiritimatiellae bacterium]|nr:hypothetical protein [Kiritimatiellia bacterium]